MHNLQHCQRLGPFGELADAAIDVLEADEGDEEEDAAQDGCPEEGTQEVVGNQVVLLLLCVGAAVGRPAGVHGRTMERHGG